MALHLKNSLESENAAGAERKKAGATALGLAGLVGAVNASCGSAASLGEADRDASEDTSGADQKAGQDTPQAGPDSPAVEAQQPAGPVYDSDNDGFPDSEDKCPLTYDDKDSDGKPLDFDKDNVPNSCDNCLLISNADQADSDPVGGIPVGDGIGDACDKDGGTVFDPTQKDSDLDGIMDVSDTCPETPTDADGNADKDGDTFGAGCDCNDDPNATDSVKIYPGAPDQPCDGFDSDCDGNGKLESKNGDMIATINGEPGCDCVSGDMRQVGIDGVGPCTADTETCTYFGDGVSKFVVTQEGIKPANETCNGTDDDCDGTKDELATGGNCACIPGIDADKACGIDKGECYGKDGENMGTQTCLSDGTWSDCQGDKKPTDEVCDEKDNDCDGDTDEGFGKGEACGKGECTGGEKECIDGTKETRCSTMPGGTEDKSSLVDGCDGKDNNCDGIIDNKEGGYTVVGGVGTAAVNTSCKVEGICGNGVTVCVADDAVECNSTAKKVDVQLESPNYCNKLDDNCNGVVDEGCACTDGQTQPCGTSTGVCEQGVNVCVNGTFSEECGGVKYVGPTAEKCNGVDDNCDGVVDNINGYIIGTPCDGGFGVCDVKGQWECDGEDKIQCSTAPHGTESNYSPEEICNGQDDDCDGLKDEGYFVGQPCFFPGVCGLGTVSCVPENPNAITCSSLSKALNIDSEFPNYCDKLDNNCNGVVDEGCICATGEKHVCGTDEGVCSTGFQKCEGGAWSTTCEGEVKGDLTEKCDGLDNNCNGSTDEGYSIDVHCVGEGECAKSPIGGSIECNSTQDGVICSTDVGGSQHFDKPEVCNYKDDDCDGQIDEGIGNLNIPGSFCSLPGECGGSFVVCKGLSDTACASELNIKPEICDYKDNDCNGIKDDGFNTGGQQPCSEPGICGGGVIECKNTSSTQCSSIKNKQPNETCGNSADDDCDGQTDEGCPQASNEHKGEEDNHQAIVLTKADIHEVPYKAQLMQQADLSGSGATLLGAMIVVRGLMAAQKFFGKKAAISRMK